ncbi:MAG: TIGR00730 family Rossman fold protein [Acidobacteriia bacterium]|nr:TIGR00730 family Rossman fold protein [Methyloceanibacter sp.]MCL6492341.1 TIGR00730 family Rossman fold protein [Terriglobia bacterium]
MAAYRSVAVFCGSRLGVQQTFRKAAEELGAGLGRAGLRLVYGGGSTGLMGALANAALAAGGEVIGVIPEFLTRLEAAHSGVTELVITESMHARKQRMFALADAFVMFPGGLGTLDETIEVITWRQLRLHEKPIFLCDIAGFAQPILAAIEAMIAEGFAPVEARSFFEVVRSVPLLLQRLEAVLPVLPAASEGNGSERL